MLGWLNRAHWSPGVVGLLGCFIPDFSILCLERNQTEWKAKGEPLYLALISRAYSYFTAFILVVSRFTSGKISRVQSGIMGKVQRNVAWILRRLRSTPRVPNTKHWEQWQGRKKSAEGCKFRCAELWGNGQSPDFKFSRGRKCPLFLHWRFNSDPGNSGKSPKQLIQIRRQFSFMQFLKKKKKNIKFIQITRDRFI